MISKDDIDKMTEMSASFTRDTFIDHRGEIDNLFFFPINHAALIRSVAGSVRSDHYHQSQMHITYVISGEMLYYQREYGKPKEDLDERALVVRPGQWVFTGPLMVHKSVFTIDSVVMTFTSFKSREDQDNDTFKEEF